MFRLSYHPNAFLNLKRNIQPGLVARTKILSVLELQQSTTKHISNKTGLSCKAVLYHLHLLQKERIVHHKGKRVYVWGLTGVGQQKLVTEKDV
jgi:predicted transcriptional regulator